MHPLLLVSAHPALKRGQLDLWWGLTADLLNERYRFSFALALERVRGPVDYELSLQNVIEAK